jgi:WD domain, G-beta repeat
VNSLAVLADDALIALGDNHGLIRVWDAATGRERFSLAGHTDGVTALASYKRRWLLSSGWDKTLRLWDLTTGKLVRSIARGDMSGLSLSLSSSGVVASAENSFVHLWSLAIDPAWLRYRESLHEATKSLGRSPNDLHALSLLSSWYVRCGDSALAAMLQNRVRGQGGAPVPASALPAYDAPPDAAALLWPQLYDYARRSRAPDGANPATPVPPQLEAWANAHPDNDFSKQFRIAVNLFALHTDPLQALAPIGGIVLPQELAYTSTT